VIAMKSGGFKGARSEKSVYKTRAERLLTMGMPAIAS
jgi:hypothetical protein